MTDTERLDWLEANRSKVALNPFWNPCPVRDVIDKAMAKELMDDTFETRLAEAHAITCTTPNITFTLSRTNPNLLSISMHGKKPNWFRRMMWRWLLDAEWSDC